MQEGAQEELVRSCSMGMYSNIQGMECWVNSLLCVSRLRSTCAILNILSKLSLHMLNFDSCVEEDFEHYTRKFREVYV